MDVTTEMLNAYVDGELPPDEMEHIAQMLAESPELEAYVTQQEQLRTALRMPGVMTAPVPQHLIDAVHNTPISWRWRLRRATANWLSPRTLVPAGATLAMGLVLGLMLKPAGDIANTGNGLLARGELGAALNGKLAAAGYDGQGARIGISFRNHDGQDCRTFTSGKLAGLACHNGGAWTVATLVTMTPEQAGGYRMAGSEMPDAVRQAVQTQIEGVPYDAAAEAQARARGWAGK